MKPSALLEHELVLIPYFTLIDVVFPRGIFHLGALLSGSALGPVGELIGPEIGNSQCAEGNISLFPSSGTTSFLSFCGRALSLAPKSVVCPGAWFFWGPVVLTSPRFPEITFRNL